MEQHSSEWYAARLYKFTSSCIYKLMTPPKDKDAKAAGELGATAKGYVLEKLTEEVGGFIPELNNDALTWGIENEDKAKYWYQKLTGNVLEACGFESYNEFYGGSPDGLVRTTEGHKGSFECKCPYNSTNHLKHCLIDSAEYMKKEHPDYYWQCVSHMVVQNTSFCDFISFDPRIDSDLGFFIIRIYRNEDEVKLLLAKIEKATEYKNKLRERFKLTTV